MDSKKNQTAVEIAIKSGLPVHRIDISDVLTNTGASGIITGITEVVLEDTDVVEANRADIIVEPVSTIRSIYSNQLQEVQANQLAMLRISRNVMLMRIINPPKSRNQREGRYSFPETRPVPGEPAMWGLVLSERRCGLKSRRIKLNTIMREYRKQEFLAGRDPSKTRTVSVKIVHVS